MKPLRSKIAMLLIAAVALLFFTNDFGLIDIEKTAIITAIAIDLKDDEYEVSMEVAVPEATDTNSENQKALLYGKGKTVGGAIKDMGDVSGWFPKLSFCNLIILGNTFAETNVIKVLDYFAKTLRIQDSATVVLSESTGKELLEKASPLDNISSFALQKILLKNPGFDNDVADVDIRTFCASYYSKNASSYMPMVKIVDLKEISGENSSTGEGDDGSTQSGSNGFTPHKGTSVFDATTTALFKNGIKVGELTPALTHAYNLLDLDAKETTLKVNDVEHDGEKTNYLLTIITNRRKVKVEADKSGLKLKINLDLYCRVSDLDTPDSDTTYAKNEYMPPFLAERAASDIRESLAELVQTSVRTQCDFLRIKEKLYRFNHKYYDLYKDDFLDVITPEITVNVSGQK